MNKAVCPSCKEVSPLTGSGNMRKHYLADSSSLVGDKGMVCQGSGLPPLEPAVDCFRCGRKVNPIRGVVRSHTAPNGSFCVSPRKPPETVAMTEEAQDAIGPATPSPYEAMLAAEVNGVPAILASENPGKQAIVEAALNRAVAPSQEEFLGRKEKQRATPRKRQSLEPRAAEYATWFKELFFQYQHSRERSIQATIGPSEAGSACMRKIAMKLSNCPEVNYEKDSWPAWMGTQGHSGAEKIIEWANEQSHSQRYLIEAALELGHPTVPRGHSDLFDRLKGAAIDWKFPGKSSLSKMHLDGCSEEYRIQLHIYGYGQRLAGETVREVALIALPREGGTLDDMYVFVEDFDEQVAIDAMERVRGIHHALGNHGGDWTKAPKTPSFLCGWCSYYLPNDVSGGRKGCNGKDKD